MQRRLALLLTVLLIASFGVVGQAADLSRSADVIVVGGGGAGLAAAVEAAQQGASVILLEKMAMLGGNTIRSGGAYNAVDPERQAPQGIEDSIEWHYYQTLKGGDYEGDPALVATFVEGALGGIHWLESLGIEFRPNVFTVVGSLWTRAHLMKEVAGTGYIMGLEKVAKEKGVNILKNTRATNLLTKGRRVIGVEAVGKDGKVMEFRANKGVVLASGGFAGNIELRMQYNDKLDEKIGTTNHPGATGDGIIMAQDVGADVVGMKWIQLLPLGTPGDGALHNWVEAGADEMIFINKYGKRFVREDARRDDLTAALFAQPDSLMYVVVDSKCHTLTQGQNNWGQTADELVKEGHSFQADTIEELAKQIGVPADALVATVNNYNSYYDAKLDKEFGKELMKARIDTPPFYASPRVPTVHHTMGGVKINTEAQVIGIDGKVIPGLYAAGEVTGGIHGTNRLGGNAIADIIVFGRIAGGNAAKGE
ncbi:MAG: flavocytochrome c [Limnochordia bacterium]|jgi:urocanate reductase